MTETWTVTMIVPEVLDVEQAGETVEIEVSEDEPILYAARRNEVWLPADCQQGWCTTCAAKLIEGEVNHATARRYYEEDAEAGFLLTCTAKPRSDVTIEVGKLQEMLEMRAGHDLPPGNSKL